MILFNLLHALSQRDEILVYILTSRLNDLLLSTLLFTSLRYLFLTMLKDFDRFIIDRFSYIATIDN